MVDEDCPGTRHGSEYAYRKCGCRCTDTVAKLRAVRKAYQATRTGSGRVTDGRRLTYGEIWYEYQAIRALGMTHEIALADVGLSLEAWTLMLRRLGVTQPVVKTGAEPVRRGKSGSLAGMSIT